jgi:hypothetical protein
MVDPDPEGLGDLPVPAGTTVQGPPATIPDGIENEHGVVWEPRPETLQLRLRAVDDRFDLVWLRPGGIETAIAYEEPLSEDRERMLSELQASIAPPDIAVELYGIEAMPERQGEVGRTLFEALFGDDAVQRALNQASTAASAHGESAATVQLIIDEEARWG